MEKFEYFPIKCRTKRASDLRESLCRSDDMSISAAAQSTAENKVKKPLKSKV